MFAFYNYFIAYWRGISRMALGVTILLLAVLVTINYTVGIEDRIKDIGAWYLEYGIFAVFYGGVIAVAWAVQRLPVPRELWRVLALAPLYFAGKMIHWDLSSLMPGEPGSVMNRYGQIVLQWPGKLALLLGLLWIWRRIGWLDPKAGFGEALGLTATGFNARPYLLLLLMLVPVVALASTQPDFLRVYPKVRTVAFVSGYAYKIIYELAYGLDFLSIELFFRGLLVIAVTRYAGEKAILPMAAFYCTIHFGKPLGECITSFAGGLALGVLAYRTRSILGGLMVHLGLAWMMEIGGWIGSLL